MNKTTRFYILFTVLFAVASIVNAQQNDTLPERQLQEVEIMDSFRIHQGDTGRYFKNSLNKKEISFYNAPTTADALAASGLVNIQKSQQGGGSAVLRGFEASRIGMMIDGVKMNNLIYRAGHLQNLITVDQELIENIKVIWGPSGLRYGSDALGGFLYMKTIRPVAGNEGEKTKVSVNGMMKAASVNTEFAKHVRIGISGSKWGSLTAVTLRSYSDLKSGQSENPFYKSMIYERKFYVDRINEKDTLIENPDSEIQKHSGYKQGDILQKFLFIGKKSMHEINLQGSTSTNVPRYDRLTDENDQGNLSYAEWYYGPQDRTLASYKYTLYNNGNFITHSEHQVSHQFVSESRHNRRFNSSNLDSRIEKVNVGGISSTWYAKHDLVFGAEAQLNFLKSTAFRENINSGIHSNLDTRYPDGDNRMHNAGVFIEKTFRYKKFIFEQGLRATYSTLYASFKDTSFYKFPFKEVSQDNLSAAGSLRIIGNLNRHFDFYLAGTTGYRVPNIDDLAKVFESSAGRIIIPNADLKPEKTIGAEAGYSTGGNILRFSQQIFYTRLYDALVADNFSYNGSDSIIYDGMTSAVYALQNQRKAFITGVQSQLSIRSGAWIFAGNISYTYGRIETPGKDIPLDHIPPVFGSVTFDYNRDKWHVAFNVLFNGWKRLKDYNPDGEDNLQYATPEGMPAWYTINLRGEYLLNSFFRLQGGIENILDIRYRTFSSGINAPGRNFYISLRWNINGSK